MAHPNLSEAEELLELTRLREECVPRLTAYLARVSPIERARGLDQALQTLRLHLESRYTQLKIQIESEPPTLRGP